MDSYVWRVAALLAVAFGVGYLVLDDVLMREALWLAMLGSATLTIVLGVRGNRPSHRGPWMILLAGISLLSLGYVVDYPAWSGATTRLIADLVTLVAYPTVGIGALGFARLQTPGGDREGAIDGTIVMIALATVLAGTVFDPSALGAGAGPMEHLLMIVAPVMLAAVFAASLRLLFAGTTRVVSAWILVGAASTATIGTVTRTMLTFEGSYSRGSAIDLFLIAAYVGTGLAALHPSMGELTEPAPPAKQGLSHIRVAILGACLLAAPLTLVISDPSHGVSLPIVSSVLLSLLVLWRLARLVVERESARKALHHRAERQEVLARLGHHALVEGDLDSLFGEATRSCTNLLELHTCTVSLEEVATPEGGVALPLPGATGGTLVAVRDEDWNDEDIALLRAVANVLAGAIDRNRTQQVMHHQAVHDSLTGLPNRVLVLDRLSHALAQATRSGGLLAVMFIDLDGFKQINDRYGHHIGDELLIAVSRRLSAMLRGSDTIGRLAGDEFVVVGENVDADHAEQLAVRIVAGLGEPFHLSCGEVSVGGSVGMVISDGAETDPEQLLADADAAMYVAKGQHGSAFVRFDGELGSRLGRTRCIEQGLHVAVERDELWLAYQPLMAIAGDGSGSPRVVGVEALLRWDHPEEGAIPPAEFIPVADSTGLIVPVGDWVLAQACKQLALWADQMPEDMPFTLFVNLSARQLLDPGLPDRVEQLIAASGVDARRLGFEVTEGALLSEDAIRAIGRLGALGVRLALDDFGTGFSSLTHLKRIALDLIKIDASFVDGVACEGQDRAIVRGVVAIASELGVDVLAEGIETDAQLAAVRELGSGFGQGFLLGRPGPEGGIILPLTTPTRV